MYETATDRLRGCDPAADGPGAVLVCGPRWRRVGPTTARLSRGGRSVAFYLWNVMWWSCGGFSTVSRKSVWILFPSIFPRLHPSTPVALWVFCHLMATKDKTDCCVRSNCSVKLIFSQICSSRALLFIYHGLISSCTSFNLSAHMQKVKLVADSVVISLTQRTHNYLNVNSFRAFFTTYSWSFKLSTE